ncbi:MAG: cytochrome C [Rhodocyclaceae bacterium]|nr:MAG: cytochrome C [Rhodocyclaceae bacterium]
MKLRLIVGLLFGLSAAMSMTSVSAAVDAEGAKALAKSSDCLKCHAVDKDKKGPSYKKVATKYKGKADAEDKVTKFVTSGQKVKLDDGKEEDHKVVDSKDPKQVKNLVQWILAQ